MFKLIWNNEIIEDEIKTKEEALYLCHEYNMAYNGGVSIKRCYK